MKQYQVTIGFQGKRTNEHYIEPGIYDEGDSRLHGCGAYLVTQGKATVIEVVEEVLAGGGSDIADAIQTEINVHETSNKKAVKAKGKR